MGTTNQHRTRGRKPCLVNENCRNSRRRKDDDPDNGSGQTLVGIWSSVSATPATSATEEDLTTQITVASADHQHTGFVGMRPTILRPPVSTVSSPMWRQLQIIPLIIISDVNL
ncbi:hypothetical protein TNCV_2629341 [Trichonephila clavipes]|uniref:Uncharacterized protein n=1 Tax=Trichonephila clavipes TaxID=2585209 RepID=A0A8X6SF57_TRICX|nr:hypothetical protein TNCV_2629341 [Trichonephila clavipes]